MQVFKVTIQERPQNGGPAEFDFSLVDRYDTLPKEGGRFLYLSKAKLSEGSEKVQTYALFKLKENAEKYTRWGMYPIQEEYPARSFGVDMSIEDELSEEDRLKCFQVLLSLSR